MNFLKSGSLAYALKHGLRDTMRMAGLDVSVYRPRGKENLPSYVDEDFALLYKKYCGYTMVPWQGLYAAYSAAKHAAVNNIPGAIVECGVWKGGCIAIMAETLHKFAPDQEREFYLYDTYAGMAEPGEEDMHVSGQMHANDIYRENQKDDYVDWCYGPYEEVEAFVKTLPYDAEKFHLVKGLVEETIPASLPEKIAVLRLDTDWYDSTMHELNHMFPLLQDGGFLLVDDYGSWAGSKKAVDEYFTTHGLNQRMLLNAVHGHGSVMGQLFPKKKDAS